MQIDEGELQSLKLLPPVKLTTADHLWRHEIRALQSEGMVEPVARPPPEFPTMADADPFFLDLRRRGRKRRELARSDRDKYKAKTFQGRSKRMGIDGATAEEWEWIVYGIEVGAEKEMGLLEGLITRSLKYRNRLRGKMPHFGSKESLRRAA